MYIDGDLGAKMRASAKMAEHAIELLGTVYARLDLWGSIVVKVSGI